MVATARPGQALRWLGGKIDFRVRVNTGLVGDAIWNKAEWDTALWTSENLQWQDITSYVMGITFQRGKERWDTRYTAGTASIQLDNRTGIFSPDSDDPLWDIPFRPGRLMRISCLPDPTSSDEVNLFTGRILDIKDRVLEGGLDAVTTVNLADGLSDLQAINLAALETPTGNQTTSERIHSVLDRAGIGIDRRLIQPGLHTIQTSALANSLLEEAMRASDAEGGAFYADGSNNFIFKQRDYLEGGSATMLAYEEETLLKGPLAYWRMTGGATADETGNGHTLTWSGSPTTGASGVTAEDSAVQLDGTNDVATVANESDLELHQDMTWECWFKNTAPNDTLGADLISIRNNDDNDYLFRVTHATRSIGVAPNVSYSVYPANTASGGQVISTLPYEVDTWTHAVVTVEWFESSRRVRLYVNGFLRSSMTFNYLPSAATRTVRIGSNGIAGTWFQGAISEMAIYDYVLTPAQVLHQYNARNRDLNDRSINVQGYLGYQEIQDAGVPHAHIADVSKDWDLLRIRNYVSMARAGGSAQIAEDETSQQLNGIRSYQRHDLYNNDDSEVAFLAERFLAAYKDPRERIESVTIVANDDPNNEDLNRLFYGTEFGDLLKLKVKDRESLAHVIGMRHRVTPEDWTVVFTLADDLVPEE